MSATAPYLAVSGQLVTIVKQPLPSLGIDIDALVGADPAFETYQQVVNFDLVTDRVCLGAELGDAIPVAMIDRRDGHVTGIRHDGGRGADICDCHCLVWPTDMLAYNAGYDTYECPRNDNPLPASFQRQAMR